MEFHDLEVFIAVIGEKSFSKAAKRVFRTQPAVSLSIRRLEEELGGDLFDRASKEPILTDLGELLLNYAKQIIHVRDQIRPAVMELKNLERGMIQIGANEIGVIFLLPHILAFQKKYPHIKIEVYRSHSRDIPTELVNRKIDLGIIGYDLKDDEIDTSVVYEDYLTLVVYPSHPLAKKKMVSLKQLANEVFVLHIVESTFRSRMIKLFESAKITLDSQVALPTIESIKKYVQMGQAISIVPRMSIETELSAGRLVEVVVPEIKAMRKKLRIAKLKTLSTSQSANAFLDMMIESLNKKKI